MANRSQQVHQLDLSAGTLRAEGPRIESRWGNEVSGTCPGRPWGPPSLLYYVYRVFLGGKTAGAWS
jgi:hypothetical protein